MLDRRAAYLLGLVLLATQSCATPEEAPRLDTTAFPVARDLTAELPLAAIATETREIDFGAAESRHHLINGWGKDEVDATDGTTFVWALGEASQIDFELLEPRAIEASLRCRAFVWEGSPQQSVRVEINGHEAATLRFGERPRDRQFTLAPEHLQAGNNRLTLRHAYNHAPSEVVAGALDARSLAIACGWLRFGPAAEAPPRSPEVRPEGLYLPLGTEVRFALRLSEESLLQYRDLSSQGHGRRLRIQVLFDEEGSQRQEFEVQAGAGSGEISLGSWPPRLPEAQEDGSHLVEIRLAALVDGAWPRRPSGVVIGRLDLRSRPEPAPRPATDPGSATASEPAADAARPNVIVYLVDTLRADHLGCYGYPEPISPRIDAFADDAVLFEHPLAQSSWTRSSVASIMTGQLPTAHGVHDRDDALADDALTLAEIFAAEGYATAAFVTNRSVGATFGFQQGFDDFEFFARLDSAALYAKSDAVNAEVFDWLDQRPDRPFFLYVHTMDPHAPYAPPPVTRDVLAPSVRQPALSAEERAAFAELLTDLAGRFGPPSERDKLGSVPWLQALHRQMIAPTPEITADLTALYNAEIAFNDRSFGALIDRLRQLGLYDDAVIIFVADHGEELHDHGSWSHGSTLFQEQLRVPLIV
ncbi:MAG: sulfatase, partial [Acidobacteriota bacterium]